MHWGRHPLGRHPPGRHLPPWADTSLPGRHPLPWADTPGQTHTPLGRHPPGRHPRTDTTPFADSPLGMPRSPWVDTPSRHPLGRHTPWVDTTRADTPPPPTATAADSRWYASYWNAFLFMNCFYRTGGGGGGSWSPRPPGSATGCFQSE